MKWGKGEIRVKMGKDRTLVPFDAELCGPIALTAHPSNANWYTLVDIASQEAFYSNKGKRAVKQVAEHMRVHGYPGDGVTSIPHRASAIYQSLCTVRGLLGIA